MVKLARPSARVVTLNKEAAVVDFKSRDICVSRLFCLQDPDCSQIFPNFIAPEEVYRVECRGGFQVLPSI